MPASSPVTLTATKEVDQILSLAELHHFSLVYHVHSRLRHLSTRCCQLITFGLKGVAPTPLGVQGHVLQVGDVEFGPSGLLVQQQTFQGCLQVQGSFSGSSG